MRRPQTDKFARSLEVVMLYAKRLSRARILFALGLLMMVHAVIGLSVDFGAVRPQSLPFSYPVYLVSVAILCAVSAVAKMLSGGSGWTRWLFVVMFALVSYQLLTAGNLPDSFPTSPQGRLGAAAVTALLTFGSMALIGQARRLKYGD